jgi:hypothetical protein
MKAEQLVWSHFIPFSYITRVWLYILQAQYYTMTAYFTGTILYLTLRLWTQLPSIWNESWMSDPILIVQCNLICVSQCCSDGTTYLPPEFWYSRQGHFHNSCLSTHLTRCCAKVIPAPSNRITQLLVAPPSAGSSANSVINWSSFWLLVLETPLIQLELWLTSW